MVNDEARKPPVYVSYSTFQSAIRGFASEDGSVPRRIDKSLLTNMSGANQSLFLSALGALGLVDKDNAPSKRLTELAGARSDEDWRSIMANLLRDKMGAYLPILKDGTPSELAEALGGGFSGSVKSKAVRFLVAAAEDSGLPVAKHHKKKTGSSAPRTPRRKRGTKNGTPESNGSRALTDDGDLLHYPLYIPGKPEGRLSLPKKLDPEDIPLLEAALNAAKLYAERQAAQKGGA